MNTLLYYALLLASAVLGMFVAVVVFLQVIGYVGVPLLIGLPLLAYLAVALLAAFVLVRVYSPYGRRLLYSNLVLLALAMVSGVLLGTQAV